MSPEEIIIIYSVLNLYFVLQDDIMKKSGNWSGFFTYGKTTGSRNPFDVHITFKRDGASRVLEGTGKDEGGEFELKGSLETDEIIRFRKQYMDQTNGDLSIKYAARLKGEAQMEGRWWIPGHPKMHGDFYMHFQPYEVGEAVKPAWNVVLVMFLTNDLIRIYESEQN